MGQELHAAGSCRPVIQKSPPLERDYNRGYSMKGLKGGGLLITGLHYKREWNEEDTLSLRRTPLPCNRGILGERTLLSSLLSLTATITW